MIQVLVNVLDSAAEVISIATRKGLVELKPNPTGGTMPMEFVGAGQFKPVGNDLQGSWSYWRLLNDGVVSEKADVFEACAGLRYTMRLRHVMYVDRDGPCGDITSALTAVANNVRANTKAMRTALSAASVTIQSASFVLGGVYASEFGKDGVDVPTGKSLVAIDFAIVVVGTEACILGCTDGEPFEVTIPDALCPAVRVCDTAIEVGDVPTWNGTEWFPEPGGGGGGGTGDVTGPASSGDGNIVLFDGITGKIIEDSGINLSEIVEEDPGPGVGIIESGAGVSPIILKNAKAGPGLQASADTGSFVFQVKMSGGDLALVSDISGDPVEVPVSETTSANAIIRALATGKIDLSYLPDSILGQVEYMGTWDATTNTPTLANPPALSTKGNFYITTVGGTQFGISFGVGDWIISDGTAWSKVDNTDAVSSVFGRIGNILAANGDYTASQVTNVPAGGIAAVTVQAAIDELDTEKLSVAAAAAAYQPLDADLTSIAALTPSDGDTIVRVAGAWVNKERPMVVAMFGSGTWTNMPAAATFLLGSAAVAQTRPLSLASFTQARLVMIMGGTAGAAAAKIYVRYRTAFSATVGDYLQMGSTEIQCAINVTNTTVDSGWIDLVAGAKADVCVTVIGSGGDGAIDPIYGVGILSFR